MVKRCSWGTCNSDTRYPERLTGNVSFIPFPKPIRNLTKCRKWIRLCGRPYHQLNEDLLKNRVKAKHYYVCTKHFRNSYPTPDYPDPLPAHPTDQMSTPKAIRPPPKQRYIEVPVQAAKSLPETYRVMLNGDYVDENRLAACSSSNEVVVNERDEQDVQAEAHKSQNEQNKENEQTDLDLLASENAIMKEEMAKLILEKENLMRIVKEKEVNSVLSESKIVGGFSCTIFKVNNKIDDYKYYTGFSNVQFSNIFTFLVPNIFDKPFTFTKTVSSLENIDLHDQLLFVLMKLRQNFDFKHLSKLFEISPQDCSTLFSNWINFMFYRFGSVSIWPQRNVIEEYMPPKFKEDFPNTFAIFDGTEIKIQKPSSLMRQSQCYSDYKSSTTLKGLVGIDPRGSVIFSSTLFSGSVSDKEITVKSGLLKLLKELLLCGKLQEGDGIMVDKGFLIQNEINNLGLKLNIPPFAPSEGQMTAGDVTLTRKIAAHRVHVERAISRIKKFKILDHRVDLSLFASINQIWFVCCFLTNFMPFLISLQC